MPLLTPILNVLGEKWTKFVDFRPLIVRYAYRDFFMRFFLVLEALKYGFVKKFDHFYWHT